MKKWQSLFFVFLLAVLFTGLLAFLVLPKRGEMIPLVTITPLPSTPTSITSMGTQSLGIMQAPTGLLNLNLATQADLEALPGIGETKAKAILAWRQEHGGFKNLEELLEIAGIGESLFDQLRPLLTIHQ